MQLALFAAVSEYSFDGKIISEFEYYCNRNGRYRVYKVYTNRLHIELRTDENEV